MPSVNPPAAALTRLPPEIITRILTYVPPKDLFSAVSKVNRQLHALVPTTYLYEQLHNEHYTVTIRPTDLRDGGVSHRCIYLWCTHIDPVSATATFTPMPGSEEDLPPQVPGKARPSHVWFDRSNTCEMGSHTIQLDHRLWQSDALRSEFPYNMPWGNEPRRLLSLSPYASSAESRELFLSYHMQSAEERQPCLCRQPPEHFHSRHTDYLHVKSLSVKLSWILSGLLPPAA